MNMTLKSGAENDSGSIIDARDAILKFLQDGQAEAASSVHADQFNDESDYGSGHYESKERRGLMATFEGIFSIADEEVANYASLQAYLTERCQQMMHYPEAAWKPVTNFVVEQFGVVVKPITGPTPHYMSCIEDWVNEYGLQIEEIQAFMPYEKFAGMTDEEAVDAVFDHFKIDS